MRSACCACETLLGAVSPYGPGGVQGGLLQPLWDSLVLLSPVGLPPIPHVWGFCCVIPSQTTLSWAGGRGGEPGGRMQTLKICRQSCGESGRHFGRGSPAMERSLWG